MENMKQFQAQKVEELQLKNPDAHYTYIEILSCVISSYSKNLQPPIVGVAFSQFPRRIGLFASFPAALVITLSLVFLICVYCV